MLRLTAFVSLGCEAGRGRLSDCFPLPVHTL